MRKGKKGKGKRTRLSRFLPSQFPYPPTSSSIEAYSRVISARCLGLYVRFEKFPASFCIFTGNLWPRDTRRAHARLLRVARQRREKRRRARRRGGGGGEKRRKKSIDIRGVFAACRETRKICFAFFMEDGCEGLLKKPARTEYTDQKASDGVTPGKINEFPVGVEMEILYFVDFSQHSALFAVFF